MQAVQLFARKQEDGQWVKLDLFAEEAIKLTLSVQDILDPTLATSIFSRTFRIPNTSINAPYFESVFNVNSTDFDASKKAEAYINDNGIFFTNGNIRLNAIYTNDKSGDIQYEITFYGETSDFGSKIGGGFLNQVDISKYNHDKSWPNISNSWTNGLFNGDIVYGLIEWGYAYTANNQPAQPTLSNGFQKSFTNPSFPLEIAQWKPQIRAKALWDAIFSEAGYTYDSEFLESDLFKKLYIISDNDARSSLGTSNLMHAQGDPFLCVAGAIKQFLAPVVFTDPGNNYNAATSQYKTPTTGQYTFELSYYHDVIEPQSAITAMGYIRMKDEYGMVIDSVGISDTGYGQKTVILSSNIPAGVKVSFEILYVNTGSGNPKVSIDSPTIMCTGAPNVMSISTILPANIRKIDFMKSIINRFRLVFVPSRDQQNHFTITPWKDWILQGQTKDWTAKLNTAKDLKIQPLFFDQARLQIYKDQEDGDFINYNYQLTYKQTVGQLNLDSNNELITGVKEYKDQFAPTPISPIGYKTGDINGSRFLIPHIAKDTGSSDDTQGTTVITGKREPIQPKLRLVFYNGLVGAPLTWYAATNATGSQQATLTQYPLMSQYSAWPTTPTTFDLNWENEAPFWDTTDTALPSGQTSYSCFNVYWKTWYDVTFDPYSRLVDAHFILDYNDILDLKFNDYVFVKDAWYFVNKIQDYVVGGLTECKVQLVKLGNNVGIVIPNVEPTAFPSIYLCKADTACNAFCCAPPLSSSLYYINAVSLNLATQVYLDPQGSGNAAPGIYSDGTTTVQVNEVGQITSILNTSGCNCVQTAYEYTTKFASNACDSCCDGITTIVYSASPTYSASVALFLNGAMTIPAPAGFYRLSTETGSTFQVGQNGLILNSTICSNCICETYYEHPAVCAGGNLCEACCCTLGSQSVWTNNATFNLSTQMYQNNVGTPMPTGYYKKGNDVAVIATTPGVIDSYATCGSCTCGEGNVDVTVEIFQEIPGFTSSATLQSSIDNINWTNVTTLSVIPSDPANTTASQTVQVLEGRYLRCQFTSNVNSGDLNSIYTINTTNYNAQQVATPGSYTQVIPGIITESNTYGFTGSVLGGIVPPPNTTTIYVAGKYDSYQNTGWPTGGSLGSILGLNSVADIYTPFNVINGFSGTNLGQLNSLSGDNNDLYVTVAGPTEYQGLEILKPAVKLKFNGQLDTTFYNNFPILGTTNYTGHKIKPIGDRVYFFGQQQNNNYAILATDKDGNFINTFVADIPAGSYVADVVEYDGLIYLVGVFFIDNRLYPFRVLNYDGTVNTNRNGIFALKSPTAGSGIGLNLQVYNNKFYVSGGFTRWNGTIINRFAVIDPITADLDTSFHTTTGGFTGGGGTVLCSAVNANGVYVSTNCTTYKGSAIHPVVKLNFDGSLDTSFVTGSILDKNNAGTYATDIKLAGNGDVYIAGGFKMINNITSKGIAKLNGSTGALETQFDVNEGLEYPTDNPGGGYLYIINGQTTTYPLTVDFNDDACTAFCTTPNETVYGNGITLLASSILYYNAIGSITADPGYYSDGVSVAQVGANGVIVGYYNTNNCNCGGQTLYQFRVTYSATNLCTSCCNGLLTNVWGTQPVYSDNAILYADALGTTFAASGWYARYAGISLQVNSNGVVINNGDCVQQCSCAETCAEYRIRNTETNVQISYSYTDCFGNSFNGTLNPNQTVLTSCTDQSNINVTGSYTLQEIAVC